MRGIRDTSVDLPDPVGPTIARLVPSGTLQVDVFQHRLIAVTWPMPRSAAISVSP